MAACPALFDRNLQTLAEKDQSLCEYAGKVVLVVNTASECGYTPQYNQYAIDFPLFAKSALKTNPLYADLIKASGEAPSWNFHKYLVDRKGARVQSFGARVEPNDPKLVSAIERLLEERP